MEVFERNCICFFKGLWCEVFLWNSRTTIKVDWSTRTALKQLVAPGFVCATLTATMKVHNAMVSGN
jgi:hypothetical protein